MPRPTRMSWMEMTEQGKAMAEVTFTITESTSSGNSYLKYCGDKEPIAAMVATLPSWVQTPVPCRAGCLTCGWAAVALKLNLSLVLQRARER